MSFAELYSAKRIEGLHNGDQRFPFAALAAQMSDADRNHLANTVQRYPIWADGGCEVARSIAEEALGDAR